MISPSENVQTLERGNVYFIYQPRVEHKQAESLKDVQRLYMVLAPSGKQVYRLAVIGQKKMPEPEREGRSRYWGFIDKVEKDAKKIEAEFDPTTYETRTRGEREVPAARPAGEGVYRIVRHEDHTHLIYALELPEKPGQVQDALNIESEASYIIQIKNPERGSPQAPGLDEDRQAEYPEKLQERFEDRKFYDADPPEFLDYTGTEFLLISAAEDVKEELGIDLDPQKESEDTAEIFNDLRMERSEHPTEPLLKGKWE